MKRFINSILFTTTIAFFIVGCTSQKDFIKNTPNELAIANECKNDKQDFELDCYDLISYKNSFAQLRLGVYAQSVGNYKEAFQRYAVAKEKGNFYVNALLADMYNKGQGVKQDKEKVISLLKEVSDVDPMAAYKLAFYYLDKKDYDETIELLEFAGKNGIKPAQKQLYSIFLEGDLTKVDVEKSDFWLNEYRNNKNDFVSEIYGM